MDQKYWNIVKKFLIACIMALVTSVIGIIMTQLAHEISEGIPCLFNNGANSKLKGLNSYEKTIHANLVQPENIKETLDNVGGLGTIKQDIKTNVLLPLKHPHIFFSEEDKTLRPSRGILLHGPPGVGKTMIARAIACEANVPFISLSLSDLENKYYGESNKLVQATFSLARKLQPCIVFFDEIDGLIRTRSDFEQSATYGLKTELLSQIDGMSTQSNDSIFVVGTTNNLSALDPALRRRLPKVYEINLPNETERLHIIKLKLENESIDESTLRMIAQKTEGFSGSDLSELLRRAFSLRLNEQCSQNNFEEQLQYASCVKDVTLLKIQHRHFEEALQLMGKMKLTSTLISTHSILEQAKQWTETSKSSADSANKRKHKKETPLQDTKTKPHATTNDAGSTTSDSTESSGDEEELPPSNDSLHEE